MRKIVIIFFSFCFLFSEDIDNMSLIELYKNNHHSRICSRRWVYINRFVNKREDLLSLVAQSCLKTGNLIPALDVAKMLKDTKEGRKNATYIATLFLMKKLITQVIIDNLDISLIKIPVIKDYTLGKIYNLLQKNNYKIDGNRLTLNDDEFSYKVLLMRKENLLIKTFKDGILIKEETIW